MITLQDAGRIAVETRIEALATALQVTIHEPTRIELAKRLNRLNLYYQERYHRTYVPEAAEREPLGIGAKL